MNNISIVGRLGKDVEITQSNKGSTIGKFSVGVTRKFDKTKTDWFNCVSFGKQAEIIAQYVKKGHMIAIVGEIQFGDYTNKDGQKVYTTTLIVNNFDFIGGTPSTKESDQQIIDDFTPVDDGDMPF